MNFIKNPLLIVIFLSFIAGFAVQELSIFADWIPYFIGLMLYFSFPGIDFKIKSIIRKESLIALLLCSLIMPSLAWYGFSHGQTAEFRNGLFLVAASPSGIIMLVLSRMIRSADHNLILGNFLMSHLLLIIYLPVLVYFFQGSEVSISASKLFINTVVLISIPWGLAWLTHRYSAETILKNLKTAAAWINPVLFFIVISSSLADAKRQIDIDAGLAALFLIVLFMYITQAFLAYSAGWFFFSRKSGNALALSASSKNIQLTLGIAILNYDILTTIPIVLGIVAHHISNGFWIWVVTGREDSQKVTE
ncbi:MAG: hypothetical protein OEZ34_07380 [Spirochaetia bacterium]|nr:hypothetical protein [Spirochaetia bacterium]